MDTTKIIIGTVGGGRYTVTAPIVKEDYGLYLKIEGIELPASYEVDFSNSEHNGTSVTMIGNADGVLIPSQFIKSGKDVFAFLYHVGENYGRTIYKFRIPNKLRPDRTEETPTPEEQSVIDQTISALNTAVEQTAQDKADADVSAQNANADAERAEEARTDAQNYATQAEQSATDAHESASQASASASASAQSASNAETARQATTSLVAEAQGYAQASAQSASASANSASQASASATSASQSATSAQGYASQAQTSAQTASSKASEASTSASTASTKASESAKSASQALTYKTDAESAKTSAQTAQGLAESARDLAQGYAEDAQGYANDAQASAEGISASASQIAQNTANILKAFPTDTASGAVASFSDGADNIPLKSLIVNIDPVQDTSSGDPSPENICPISGWTEINAYNDPLYGGNIEWNQLVNSYRPGSTNGLTFVPDADNKSVSISGTITTAFSYDTITFTRNSPVKIKRDGRRYIIICNQATPYPIRVSGFADCVSAGSYGGVFSNYTSGNQEFTNVLAFHAMKGDTFAVSNFTVQMFDLTTMFGTEIADYIYSLEQANVGAGVTWFKKLFPEDYYEYNGGEKTTVSAVNDKPYTHVNIQLGQTVYGGKLDVLSGVLTVDRAMVDLGTLSWTIHGGVNGRFTANLSPTVKPTGNYNIAADCICDRYVSITQNRLFSNYVGIATQSLNGTTVFVYDSAYDSPADFKAAMNGAQFCYELATPLTITLTPHEVRSLLGDNNLWADSGDTEVEYRADTKLFIERLTAPDSADMIADANIQSGKYFMVGNNLFKSTANIANGSAIVVGTNCTRKSLSEALNEINA